MYSQGDISENGQRYTLHSRGAETVGRCLTSVANDWVTYGFGNHSGLNVQSGQHKSVTTGTSAAVCDQVN